MSTLTQLSRRRLMASSAALGLAGLATTRALAADPEAAYAGSPFRKLNEADWKKRLPASSFNVLRQEGTEFPFSSPLLGEHRKGTFVCLGCELPLFKSDWKYDSHTGWPSFWRAIDGALGKKHDLSVGMDRTEYHCARCLGHQGHVFDDGPAPTGLRYCNNGVAVKFVAG